MSPGRVCVGEEGEGHSTMLMDGENRKCAGTNSGESGARNLEAAIESSNPIPRLFEYIWTTIESLTTRYHLPMSNEW